MRLVAVVFIGCLIIIITILSVKTVFYFNFFKISVTIKGMFGAGRFANVQFKIPSEAELKFLARWIICTQQSQFDSDHATKGAFYQSLPHLCICCSRLCATIYGLVSVASVVSV